jgi:hypothetical protein
MFVTLAMLTHVDVINKWWDELKNASCGIDLQMQ